MTVEPKNLRDTQTTKTGLLQHLPRLVEHLFDDRPIHQTAQEYRIGTHGSISIRVADGSYFNHESGEGGDIITLIQHILKTDFKSALVWAHNFIGHDAQLPQSKQPSEFQAKTVVRIKRQRDKALAMLKRSTPIKNTLAEYYLRDKRGINIKQLPSTLKFLSHAYNYTASGFYPALIAPISDTSGEIIAAHCTFISPTTGDKLQGKGVKSRLIFGSYRGGAIQLAQATHKLALCEGIEDGLSVMQCSPDWPVWACAGTSGLRGVQVPKQVREVMICADGDEAGKLAAVDLSARLLKEDKKVRIATPPNGAKDFNDLLRMEANHAE